MSKAVAVDAIFLIAVIAIFLFFIVGIFGKWIDITKLGTGKAACSIQTTDFCRDLVNDKETKWEELPNCQIPELKECCVKFPGPKCRNIQ